MLIYATGIVDVLAGVGATLFVPATVVVVAVAAVAVVAVSFAGVVELHDTNPTVNSAEATDRSTVNGFFISSVIFNLIL